MLSVLACMTERHDPRLVLLATLICALASGTVVVMLARGLASAGRSRAAWTVGAAIAFGSGVWAVHFVAMLGYLSRMATAYDVSWTTLSLLIATLGSLPGIALFLFRPRNPLVAALGGAGLGLAITGMHFTGMMAMRLGAIVMFDRRYVAAALVLAVGFSALALVVAGRWQTALGRLLAGVLLALAVIGLHFTGMTAVALVPGLGSGIAPPDAVLTPDLLAIAVSAVSALVLLAGFTLALWDARLISSRLFNNLDKKHDNKLSELTMEVKNWNQKNGGYLTSHHIDCMTYDYFRNNKPKNGENSNKVNAREFFERIPWYLKRHVRDPVYGEKADSYLTDDRRRDVISNSKKSTKILRQAEKQARNGNEVESNRLYREFLGEENNEL